MKVIYGGIEYEYDRSRADLIAALGNSVPRKPVRCSDGWFECVCGHTLAPAERYCSLCGQKIDWEAVR